MRNTSPFAKLYKKWEEKKFLCVGLDPVFEKLPHHLQTKKPPEALLEFIQSIIDATADFVCCYKPNAAFFEAYGAEGWKILAKTIRYIQKHYPEIYILLDAKRADIGNTNTGYVQSAFEVLGVDGCTVNPYLGQEALQPFLEQKDQGIFVLVKTSNPESGEFQNLQVGN